MQPSEQINSIKIDNQKGPSWIENKNGGGRINLSPLELGCQFCPALGISRTLGFIHTHTHTLTNSHPHFSNLWPQTELHPWLSLFFRLSMAYFGISYPPQSHKPILIKKSPLIYLCFLFVLLLWRPLIYKESSQKAGITGRFRWGMKEIQTRQWCW